MSSPVRTTQICPKCGNEHQVPVVLSVKGDSDLEKENHELRARLRALKYALRKLEEQV